MPISVRDLMAHADDDGDAADDEPPNDAIRRTVERIAKTFAGWPHANFQALEDAMRERNEDMGRGILATMGAEASRKAADAAALRDAQQASREARDLAKLHQQELESLRKESDAAARKYFWLGVAVGAGFVIAGWLLSALSAAQVLSHLFHP